MEAIAQTNEFFLGCWEIEGRMEVWKKYPERRADIVYRFI